MEKVLRHRTGRRSGLLARLLVHLRRLAAVRRQRGHLGALDAHLLDDIGLTREAAAREASRPVWDVPRNWRS